MANNKLRSKLEQERDRLRAEAEAIDRALETIDNVLNARARNGLPKKLSQAIAQDKARQNGRRNGSLPPIDMAALVAAFDDTPKTLIQVRDALGYTGNRLNSGFGSLTRYGYLKRKADGYVRTAKQYQARRRPTP